MTRTTRVDPPHNIGWSSGDPDPTEDRWNAIDVYVYSRMPVARFEFKRMSKDGRRLLDTYAFEVDDETFLIDLAAICLGAVAQMQKVEDDQERYKVLRKAEPTSLDSDEDIERKREAARNAYRKKRKRTKRRRHAKPGPDSTT